MPPIANVFLNQPEMRLKSFQLWCLLRE